MKLVYTVPMCSRCNRHHPQDAGCSTVKSNVISLTQRRLMVAPRIKQDEYTEETHGAIIKELVRRHAND